MDMYPDELKVAIGAYLDKGVDFLKYGGTTHWLYPTLISFSPEAQKIIVDETHARGLVAETHSTNPEGLRLSIEAGIDLIQHPELIAERELSDELIASIKDRNIVCSMLVSSMTGDAWEEHLEEKSEAEAKRAKDDPGWGRLRREFDRKETSFSARREKNELGHHLAMRRLNAEKLIAAGCIVTLGGDNFVGAAPEFARIPKPIWQEPGIGTLMAIEGLVELGMTPSQAITAGTKNGAYAAKGSDDFGTIEVGKYADLLLFDDDPLENIGNIQRNSLVMREGAVVDVGKLPTNPVFFNR